MALLTDYTEKQRARMAGMDGTVAAPLAQLEAPTPIAGLAAPRPTSTGYTPPALVSFNAKALPAGAQANPPMDWQNIIQSNPGYMQWALGAGERADTATANRRAAMRALAIRFGGLPQNFSDVYGDIDPETTGIASANPESENARLLRSYQQQVEQSRRQLAARGGLQSGELGWGQGQLDLARQGDVYDVTNKFLDAASGTLGQYGSTLAGLNAEQIDQIRTAADKIAQDRLYQAQIDAMRNQPVYEPGGGGGEEPTDGGGGGGETTTAGGVTGPTQLNPNDPNSPWNKYTWGGQTARQTWEAMKRAGYSDADADRMTFNWMNNMGQADTTFGNPNFAPSTVGQFSTWRATGRF